MRSFATLFKNELKLNIRNMNMVIFAVIMPLVVLIILGMFTISYYSKDNVNIINYENALIDKYEKWEAELIEREKQLENK